MASLAASDITVAFPQPAVQYGRQKERIVSLTFGDSALTYPTLGVPMPSASALGLRTMKYAEVVSDVATPGTDWRWDYTNNTLRAYRQGHIPAIVIEEAVTLSSHVGTLKYKPAYIICAVGTISAAVTPLKPVPSSVTVATTQMKVNFTTGVVTCFASDSVSAMKVSYIPQQPSGPFSAANLVVDESITLATGGVNTASRAATMQYCYQTTATAARLPMGHAAASGVVALDINNSGSTTFTAHSANDAKVALVTYLKYAGFENNVVVTWFDQATITLTSEVKEWGKTAGDYVGGYMIPGLGGQVVVFHDSTSYDNTYLGDSTVTAASGIVKFDIAKQVITTAETNDGETIVDTPMLFLSPFLTPHRAMNELTTNDAPAATVLHVKVIG